MHNDDTRIFFVYYSMIKAIFFDVDGTLLSFRTHRIPSSTEKAIGLLKDKGIKIIISTGRSINSLDSIQHIDFDGYITFNGGYCVNNDGMPLFRKTMDTSDISALLDYADEQTDFCFSFMSEHEVTINRITPPVASMYRMLNLPSPPIGDYSQLDVSSILQANVFIAPEEEKQFMQEVMPNSIATRWTPLFADVNPRGQSKKVGVDIFCQQLGIDPKETLAFGDGGNDVTMLEHCGIGVAMGNAVDSLKAVADHITDEVDEDGIYNALKHLGVLD